MILGGSALKAPKLTTDAAKTGFKNQGEKIQSVLNFLQYQGTGSLRETKKALALES